MQDNRFAPSHAAETPHGEAGAASTPSAPAETGAGGGARVLTDPPAVATPHTPPKGATPAHGNADPGSQPGPQKSPGHSAGTFPDKFHDSWRENMAGGDRAFRKTLDRFENPAALAKAYRELTARLSSGDLKATKPPPGSATPEQIAAWRAEQGLPLDAAAYVDGLQLGDGTVPGEAEKTMLASFAEEAMKGRWTADQYNQAVGWYFAMQDRLSAARDHADAAFRDETSAGLMREWGHDHAANRNAIAQFFDRSFPADFRDVLLTARLPDGRILANHPAFNRAILEVAKSLNPGGKVLPNASGGGLSSVESRIAEIEGKYMRAPHGSEPWKSYWTGDSGARMQQEYRGLLAAREKTRPGRGG
jgi:hypothetical protein